MTRDPSASYRGREPVFTRVVKKPSVSTAKGKGTAGASAPVSVAPAKAATAKPDAGATKVAASGRPPSTSTKTIDAISAASTRPNVSPGPTANPSQRPNQSPSQAANAKPASARPDLHASIQIKGLKGTVNKVDVQQAMDMRQGDLDVCIANSRRGVRWVSGSMRFGCKVDPEGRLIELRLLSSNLGHRELERCVSDVVATTAFIKPAGKAIAEFAWGMSVEPIAGSKPPDPGTDKLVAKAVSKHAREAFKTCEARRGRVRLRVTAYVGVDGHMFSAGAVPTPPRADDKVDCLLDELRKWHFGKPNRVSKVSFNLR